MLCYAMEELFSRPGYSLVCFRILDLLDESALASLEVASKAMAQFFVLHQATI